MLDEWIGAASLLKRRNVECSSDDDPGVDSKRNRPRLLTCILASDHRVRHQEGAHSLAAIASQIFSMAGISAWLPGRRPFTRIENAKVLPLAVVR